MIVVIANERKCLAVDIESVSGEFREEEEYIGEKSNASGLRLQFSLVISACALVLVSVTESVLLRFS